MWRGVTAVSTLRDNLTVIVSVSLRKYIIFSYMIYFLKLTLPQYYFSHSFLQQTFTKKSKNSCRFKKFQENARFCEHLGYSWKFLNLHCFLDFLVKACRYWPLEYSRISMKFEAYN